MNRSLAFEFLLYGLLLAGASWFVHRAAPGAEPVMLITGLAGGAASLLWGALALGGYRQRWWMVLVLAAVSFALLSQAVTTWLRPAEGDGSPSRLVAVWITVLLVFSFAMLMNLLHGQGRQPADPTSSGMKH